MKISGVKTLINKIITFLNTHRGLFLCGIGVFLFVNFFLFLSFFEKTGYSFRSFRFLASFVVFAIIHLFIILYILHSKRHNWKIEHLFLPIFYCLGSLYVIFVPIGRVPDEPAHIWRAYEISNFEVLPSSENGKLGFHISSHYYYLSSAKEHRQGINDYDTAAINIFAEQSEEETIFFDGGPAANYSFINYIPQSVGILIGRSLHLPVLISAYIARFLNLFFCGLVFYLCIKYIPVLKKILFLIIFLPMTMHEIASVSGDGSIICAGLALVSLVTYFMHNIKLFSLKHYLTIIASCLALTLTKPTYALMCFLLFLIPPECFKTKKRKILFIFLLGIIDILLIILFSRSYVSTETNSTGQISFIIANPFRYLSYFFSTILTNPMYYLGMTTGEFLEWLNVSSGNFYTILITFTFALSCLEDQKTIKPKIGLYSLLCFSLTIFAVFTALYIIWTPVGGTTIEGVQGRYFIPALLLAPLGAQLFKLRKNHTISSYFIYTLVFFANACSLMSLFCAHI